MGIDLGDVVVKQPTSMQAWRGKTVAFDAWNILYQFLANIRQPDGTPLSDSEGKTTSHLAGVLYRTSNLVEAGIKPVFVFDGEPHYLKRETLAARTQRRQQAEVDLAAAQEEGDDEKAYSKAQQTSKLTAPMADEAKHLFTLLGVPVVEAPMDGEAQAAWMAHAGQVDGVCSQDFDALLYGAPRLIRNLTVSGRRKLPGKQIWVDVQPEEIPLQPSLDAMDLNHEQLLDVALLVGTDFHPGIKGIGAKKAIATIQKNGSLEALLDELQTRAPTSALERNILEQHEALKDREIVRGIFAEPAHVDTGYDTPTLNADEVRSYMVGRGFSKERVDGALKRFESAKSMRQQQSLFDF